MLTNKESKNHLLLQIESSAHWRETLSERYPNDKDINIAASVKLYQLRNYVYSLPENHQLFCWNAMIKDEDIIEWFSNELKRIGFSKDESSEKFVNRIIKKGIKRNLLNEINEDLLNN